jgi:hypothetical protein
LRTGSGSAGSNAGVVVIHGTPYMGNLDGSTPLILLFYQAGSSGRGEYSELTAWQNAAGFRAVAWDLRVGGGLHGVPNRTVSGLDPASPTGFCDAYPDLQAALDFVIAGVVAFSPASGGPMVECRAGRRIDGVTQPVLVFRPDSEMEREASLEQRTLLTESGADFYVVDHGIHGSSMLLDSRTERDMARARGIVVDWLGAIRGRSR